MTRRRRPRRVRERPKRSQDGPKSAPRAPRSAPREAKKASKMNFGSRRAPGSPPEAILERFSSLRGAIWEGFWKDFRALGKLSSELSGLCVGPPSATFFPDTHAREEDTGETQEEHTREEEHARDTGGRRHNQRRNTPELRGIFRTFLAAVSLAPSGPGPGRCKTSRIKGPGGIREPACTFAYHA